MLTKTHFLYIIFIYKVLLFMNKLDFKAAVWKEGHKYVSQCLNIEVASFGATKKEALINLQEAVQLFFLGI